jgi:hypothetical protein
MAIHKKWPDSFEWQLRRARTNACSKQVGDKRGKSQIGQTVRPAAEEIIDVQPQGHHKYGPRTSNETSSGLWERNIAACPAELPPPTTWTAELRQSADSTPCRVLFAALPTASTPGVP